MAEAIAALGVVASVVQLADVGFKLSIKLFAFGEAVSRADKSIKTLSNEISLTSAVLKELGEIFKADEARYVSDRAIKATEQTVAECHNIFEQLNKVLEKSRSSFGSEKAKDDKLTKLDRLRWPFFQPKMDLLRSNLDRLKASLALMLQVLSYARDISDRKRTEDSLGYQKEVIESLARSEREARNKYLILRKRIEASESNTSTLDGKRSLEDEPQQAPPPYTVNMASGSAADPGHLSSSKRNTSKPLVGELMLCFNMVHNLLTQHLTLVNNATQYKSYTQLRKIVENANEAELKWLEESLGDTAFQIGVEAARNAVHLQSRLRELANVHQGITTVVGKHKETPEALHRSGLPTTVSSSTLLLTGDLVPLEPSFQRSRRRGSACQQCRASKLECDGKRPTCSACEQLGLTSQCSSGLDLVAPPTHVLPRNRAASSRASIRPDAHFGDIDLGTTLGDEEHAQPTTVEPAASRARAEKDLKSLKESRTWPDQGVMQSIFTQVLERGEALDSRNDEGPNLAASGEEFQLQMQAMRDNGDPWKKIANAVNSYSTAGLQGLQTLSESVYSAGASLISSPVPEGSFSAPVSKNTDIEDMEAYSAVIDEFLHADQHRDGAGLIFDGLTESTLEGLLSEWTTITPSKVRGGQTDTLPNTRVYKISSLLPGRRELDHGVFDRVSPMRVSRSPSPGFHDITDDTLSAPGRW